MGKTAVIFHLLHLLGYTFCYRLPTIYNPMNYNVHLKVPSEVFTTADANTYNGTVSINFTTSKKVSKVVLHASPQFINLKSSILTSEHGCVRIKKAIISNTTEILTLSLQSYLKIDQVYTLNFEFVGTLSTTNLYGFYKSSYKDSITNSTVYLVTTQMEPIYARRVFPCFDEPKYKATFNISLSYPDGLGLHALGNVAPVSTPTNENGILTQVFEQSPIMSTYLVAFIISDFTCTTTNRIEGYLPNSVCSQNNTNTTRELALEVAQRSIEVLNTYLGLNYSETMTKLDQVAIPDFSAEAMENWGLVTYREISLLYDANETSNEYWADIIEVITHELTHQWFGNLVTCNWWSEIFLNEGFATVFEDIAAHMSYPEMEFDKQFVTKTVQYALYFDSDTTETLHTNVSTQKEISARFSIISYYKGGSVLRMVEHILGEDIWKKALNFYLNKYSYSSAEPDDLWKVLETNATNLPNSLTTIMDSWINSPGFPVVFVTLENQNLHLSQQRFILRKSTATNISWYIPITYTTNQNTTAFQNTNPSHWITPNSSLLIPLNSSISWVVVNNYETGYYRVNYDCVLWDALATALQQTNFSDIPDINRAQITDDAFALNRGGYISFDQLLFITKFLSNEISYHVWYSALNGFDYFMYRFEENTHLGAAIRKHVSNLISTVLLSVPLNDTDPSNHIYTLNQVLLQTWSCRLGNFECISEAVRLFEEYKQTSVKPEKNLRSIVYCYGLKYSNNLWDDFEYLWNAFLNTKSPTEQTTILIALGCPRNKDFLTSYLKKTLTDDSGVRPQDYALLISGVYSGSSIGVDMALDFFIANYPSIVARYTSMNSVRSILKGIADKITTNNQLAKLESLVESGVLDATIVEATNSTLVTLRRNLKWISTYESSLSKSFNVTENTTAAGTTTEVSNVTSPVTNPTTNIPTTIEDSGSIRIGCSLVAMAMGLFLVIV